MPVMTTRYCITCVFSLIDWSYTWIISIVHLFIIERCALHLMASDKPQFEPTRCKGIDMRYSLLSVFLYPIYLVQNSRGRCFGLSPSIVCVVCMSRVRWVCVCAWHSSINVITGYWGLLWNLHQRVCPCVSPQFSFEQQNTNWGIIFLTPVFLTHKLPILKYYNVLVIVLSFYQFYFICIKRWVCVLLYSSFVMESYLSGSFSISVAVDYQGVNIVNLSDVILLWNDGDRINTG